ncbi:MAG: hypothetical protein ACOYM5_09590 [Caulobacter sp.]
MTPQPELEQKRAQRHGLLGKVRAGQLSPQQADDEAIAAGLGSLSRLIAPEEYRPTSRPNWTMPMVLAWISWRTYSEVREWDREYLKLRRDWASNASLNPATGAQGHELVRRKRPTSAQFAQWGHLRFGPWLADAHGSPLVLMASEPESAMPTLRRALAMGSLAAVGIPGGRGARIEVPTPEWVDLEVKADASGNETLRRRHQSGVIAYTDALFPLSAIQAIWPPHGRSGLSEQDEFRVPPVVDDPLAASHLYERVDVEALDGLPPDKNRPVRRRRAHNYGDLEALILENKRRMTAGSGPFTFQETWEWAKDRNLIRDSARKLRAALDSDLKLKTGQLT